MNRQAWDDKRAEGERSARAFFKHPFVLVYDYVAGGTTLGDMYRERPECAAFAAKLLGPCHAGAAGSAPKVALSDDGRRRLRSMGEVRGPRTSFGGTCC